MSKFNTGAGFSRTINDVVNDYSLFLLQKKVITAKDYEYYTSDEMGKIEILDALLEKVNETEELPKIGTVPTISAFTHFCKFVVKEYQGRPVWNRFLRDVFDAKRRNKFFAFQASRGLGKSFFLYSLYTPFKFFTNKNYQISFFANIPIQLVENLRIMRSVIDGNEVLYSKKDIDKGKELKWTERQIEYNNGMIYSFTAGQSPRFSHVNEAIIDDIRPEKSQLTDKELIDYILSQIMPTIRRKNGGVTLSGTPIHLQDVYHYFMNTQPEWEGEFITDGRMSHNGFCCYVWPATLDGTLDGEPYLPEIYDKQTLKATLAQLLPIRFMREYLMICIDESTAIFSSGLIDACSDSTLKYLYSANHNEGGEESRYFIGVDVATSGAASADFSAFIVLEVRPTEKGIRKIVRHIIHVKGMEISEQIKTIKELSDRFDNALVMVEKNNVGVALIQELMKMNVNVEEFVTTGPKKEGMIRYLATEMANGNVWFCEDNEEIKKLKNELINFGVKITRAGNERMEALSGHDDMVMAFAMANQASQEYGGCAFAITMQR